MKEEHKSQKYLRRTYNHIQSAGNTLLIELQFYLFLMEVFPGILHMF